MFYNDFNTDTYQDKTSDGGYGAWDLASDEYACSQSGYGKGRRDGGNEDDRNSDGVPTAAYLHKSHGNPYGHGIYACGYGQCQDDFIT